MDRWRAKFHSPQPAIALPTNGINNRKSESALILVTWIWFPSLSQVLATRMFFFRNNKGSAPSARQDIRQSRIGEPQLRAFSKFRCSSLAFMHPAYSPKHRQNQEHIRIGRTSEQRISPSHTHMASHDFSIRLMTEEQLKPSMQDMYPKPYSELQAVVHG